MQHKQLSTLSKSVDKLKIKFHQIKSPITGTMRWLQSVEGDFEGYDEVRTFAGDEWKGSSIGFEHEADAAGTRQFSGSSTLALFAAGSSADISICAEEIPLSVGLQSSGLDEGAG